MESQPHCRFDDPSAQRADSGPTPEPAGTTHQTASGFWMLSAEPPAVEDGSLSAPAASNSGGAPGLAAVGWALVGVAPRLAFFLSSRRRGQEVPTDLTYARFRA